MKGLFILPVILVLLFGTPAFADFQKGLDAYQSGDYATALKEWEPLAEHGDVDAQFHLGYMYSYGQGVTRDNITAVMWYEKAAKQGYIKALFWLGVTYEDGLAGVTQDYKAAIKWYELAAEQGHLYSQRKLHSLYIKPGATQSRRNALKWLKLAAEQGDAHSQWMLGSMYRDGQGILQDYKAAIKWYKLAAEQGDATAQSNVGYSYLRGEGVTLDYSRSHMWFNISNFQGNEFAVFGRDQVQKFMTPSQIEKAQELARECVAKNYKDCWMKGFLVFSALLILLFGTPANSQS